MNIPLVHGNFSPSDSFELLNQMVQLKVKFHENKISKTSNEEDIKYRESKIKRLQNDLMELKKYIDQSNANLSVDVQIKLEKSII
jgi:hypothetical protein